MKPVMVGIGPCAIDRVPVSHFKKLPGSALKDAWHLIGPSAQMNLAKSPLWAVIAAAYLEGVQHGSTALANAAQPGGE